jgi:hypothetical protein
VYVLCFREHLSVEFPFCVLPAGEECLIRRKRNGNSVGVSGERIRCFTPSRLSLTDSELYPWIFLSSHPEGEGATTFSIIAFCTMTYRIRG